MLGFTLFVVGASLFAASTALGATARLRPAVSEGFIYGETPAVWPRLGLAVMCAALAALSVGWTERVLWLAGGGAILGEWAYRAYRARNGIVEGRSGRAARVIASERATGFAAVGRVLDRFRPVWVAALVPAFVLGGGRYILPGLMAIAILWLVTGLTGGTWGRRSPADSALVLLMVAAPGALLISSFPALTREHLGYYLAQLLAFYTAFTWVRTPSRAFLAGSALTGAGGVLALIIFLLSDQGRQLGMAGLPIVNGTVIQKNVSGGTLVVLLPVAVGLCLGSMGGRPRAQQAIFGLLALVACAGVAFSQSRGAYLAVGAALVVIALSVIRAPRWLVLGATVLLVGLSLSGALAAPLSMLPGLKETSEVAVRSEIWSRAGQAIGDYPLTGFGLGTFREVVPAIYPYVISDPEKVNHAHNLFYQVGADLGLPGLIGFVALVICLITLAYANIGRFERAGERQLQWLAVGCVAGLVAMLAHGTVDAVTWGVKPSFLAWSVLGLLLALGRIVPAAKPANGERPATYPLSH